LYKLKQHVTTSPQMNTQAYEILHDDGPLRVSKLSKNTSQNVTASCAPISRPISIFYRTKIQWRRAVAVAYINMR